jgi:GR25 family glycosyltransferase involved in LPS biosynthesis
MKAFFLNVDKAKVPRVNELCKRSGLVCERVAGIDARKVSDWSVIPMSRTCQLFCTKPMVAISLGHIRIWQKVVAERLPLALVLEDDVDFHPATFRMQLYRAAKRVPKNFHVLLLGTIARYPHLPMGRHRHTDIYETKIFGGTHAYIVSQSGARFLLNNMREGAIGHVDIVMSMMPGLRAYEIIPNIARQSGVSSSTSTIGFPNTIPLYHLHAHFMRLGTFKYHIRVNTWHAVLFACGVYGVSPVIIWTLFAADAVACQTFSWADLGVKMGSYYAGFVLRAFVT